MKNMILLSKECFQEFGKYRMKFILTVCIRLIITGLQLVEPFISALIVSALFKLDKANVIYLIFTLFAVYTIKTSFFHLNGKLEIEIQKNVNVNLKKILLNLILDVRPNILLDYGEGKLFNIISDDSLSISQYLFSLSNYIFDIIFAISAGIIIFRINIVLSFGTILFFPLRTFNISCNW